MDRRRDNVHLCRALTIYKCAIVVKAIMKRHVSQYLGHAVSSRDIKVALGFLPLIRVQTLTVLKILLLVALAFAAGFDVGTRRIPNTLIVLIFVITTIGAVSHQSTAESLPAAVLGFATGLALWFPLWRVNRIGAGDVKLFAVGASWIGMHLAWQAALLAAILGGVWSIAILFYSTFRRNSLARPDDVQPTHAPTETHERIAAEPTDKTIPYAVPIAIALALAILRPSAFGIV